MAEFSEEEHDIDIESDVSFHFILFSIFFVSFFQIVGLGMET